MVVLEGYFVLALFWHLADPAACGTPAGLFCCSHEDIAHRSACAPGACSGRRVRGLSP